MKEFEVGDVVVMKSGGIKMLVNHIEGDVIETTWQDNKTQEDRFAKYNKALLKIYEEPEALRSTSVPSIVTF